MAAPDVAAILEELGVSLDEDAVEYLAGTFAEVVEDDGALPEDMAENMCGVLHPMVEDAGYDGDEDSVRALCLRALAPPPTAAATVTPAEVQGTAPRERRVPDMLEDEQLPWEAASGDAAGPDLEDIWELVQALGDEEFAQLQEELGELIVERGLGGQRYFPPGSVGPGGEGAATAADDDEGASPSHLEPEPEPRGPPSAGAGSAAEVLSAQLMRDASVQARKAQQARAEKLAAEEAVVDEQAGAGVAAQLSTVQALLGVSLEADVMEYLEGMAAGLREELEEDGGGVAEAAEQLHELVAPMLEDAGAAEEVIADKAGAIRKACEQMLTATPAGAADGAAAGGGDVESSSSSSSSEPAPLVAVQALLGVSLEADVVEYLEGTAAGLREEVEEQHTGADDAAEQLFSLLGPMLEEAGAEDAALEAREAELRQACARLVVAPPPAPAPAEAAAAAPVTARQPLRGRSLREQVGQVEAWRITGVGQTQFAMDAKGLSAQEALRAREREAAKKELTPAQVR
jgi:hypothetical protein